MNKLFLAAAAAALLAAPPASALHISVGRATDGNHADLRLAPDAKRVSSALRSAEAARLGAVSELARLAMKSTTADGAGIQARLVGNQAQVNHFRGALRADRALAYRLQPVPNDLTGGTTVTRIQPLNQSTMRLLADFYG